MSSNPLISVLMAVYNGEKYLREAIDSILNQTYTNFEFLIVNDGSIDLTEDIILSYSDNRIRYIKNETNLKLIASLNKGLDLAIGKYIARMDADDISLPERLEKQVDFMERNQEIGVLGTSVKTIGLENNYEVKFEKGHDAIRLKLLFNNYLHHPTVMLRKTILDNFNLKYPDVLHAEDYALWIEMTKYTRIEILSDVLLLYRIHGENISQIHSDFQNQQTSLLRKSQLEFSGINFQEKELLFYFQLLDNKVDFSLEEFEILIKFTERIVDQMKFVRKNLLKAAFFQLLSNISNQENKIEFNKLMKVSMLKPKLSSRIIYKLTHLVTFKM